MAVTMNPYLNFRGNAREAMEFYRSVLGGDLHVMTFADSGGMGIPEDEQHGVMHAQLTSPAGTLMGADVPSHMVYEDAAGFSVSLSGPTEDDATLRGYWEKLSEGATPGVPLETAPWGDTFGMLTDKYGVHWMVNISGQPQG